MKALILILLILLPTCYTEEGGEIIYLDESIIENLDA